MGAAIEQAIELKKITVANLADRFGVRRPSVYGWIRSGRIDKGKLPELYAYFADVVGPEHWGLPPGTPLYPGVAPTPRSPTPGDPGPDQIAIERVLLKVSAGVTGFSVEHVDGNGIPIFIGAQWLAKRGYKPEHLFALTVSGDSMEPSLYDGDLVIINTGDTKPVDEAVFVINYEGEIIIKRLWRDAGEWWLTSDNPRHKPKRCHKQSLLIGRVVRRYTEHI